MGLEQRVEELERRVGELEGERRAERRAVVRQADLWALTRLEEQFAELGIEDGGVLFAGSVRLPAGEQYGWQMGFSTDDLLADDGSEAADRLAALGNPVRLRLLREILGGRRTATELTALEGVGTSGQIYHHLRQLVAAGWLHAAARGRYEVPAGRVVPLLVALATTRR